MYPIILSDLYICLSILKKTKICQTNFVFLFSVTLSTHTHTGHTGFTFT